MQKEEIIKRWRKCRTDALSKMFDTVMPNGIYRTSQFYKEIDKFFEYFLEQYASQFQSPQSKGVEAKELVEALEEIAIDHYPETVFIPITDKQWAEIVKYIQRKYSIDAISGHYGRIFHKIHRDIAQKAILKWGKLSDNDKQTNKP